LGGFCYALIFVDRATWYNWVFGLKDLSKESILAGSYARCFRCDCDPKLFGATIKEHLFDHDSNLVAAAAGCQSANGPHSSGLPHGKADASVVLVLCGIPLCQNDERYPWEIGR
jgi:hypothetical protein